MVNKMYKVNSEKAEIKGSKHNQVLMSIVGKTELFLGFHTIDIKNESRTNFIFQRRQVFSVTPL